MSITPYNAFRENASFEDIIITIDKKNLYPWQYDGIHDLIIEYEDLKKQLLNILYGEDQNGK